MHEWAAKFDEFARGMVVPLGATLFEELGLYYIGPVDGTSIEDLICVLNEVASLDSTGPVLIHVITEADQGLADITNGEQHSENYAHIIKMLKHASIDPAQKTRNLILSCLWDNEIFFKVNN